MAKLEIKDIEHFYDSKKVLDIPRLAVEAGECLVILGPNGSGKSTLLRLASLLERPTRGMVFYQGEEVTTKNSLKIRRRFALLLQKPLFFQGSVESNLLFGLKLRNIPREERKKRLEKAIEIFTLHHLLDRKVNQLSGGEAQRVNLARAFVLEPDVLFLDEPFSALDAPLREEIIFELKRMIRIARQTTVFVTHHRDEAALLASRVAVLMQGIIFQEGSPEQVFLRPINDEVARFVGHDMILKGVVAERQGDLLIISLGSQKVLASGPYEKKEEVLLSFKPEDVFLAPHRFESSIRNWFEGKVLEIHSFDRFLLVYLDCGFPLKALLTRPAMDELKIKEGVRIWAGVKASSIHLLRTGSYNERERRRNDQL